MNKEHVYLIATFFVKPNKIDVAQSLFASIVPPSVNEAGCVFYDLYQDKEDACKFVFIEEWTDMASLDAHLVSPHILALKPELEDLLTSPLSLQWLNKLS